MATTQMMPPVGVGGLVTGGAGIYAQNTDGSFTVNQGDVVALLAAGFTYVAQQEDNYNTPVAPLAATVGKIVGSLALSNGTVAVTAQPDVLRPVTVEVGAGTTAITAGQVAVTYLGNDGLSTTETYSLACAASASTTQLMSRGVSLISSIVVSGLVGGASPFFRMSTTSAISVPVSQRATDFGVSREYDAGATIAVGTLSSALGSITPTTAPNGTVTYSFIYYYVAPVS
jgi:hypothetical protein